MNRTKRFKRFFFIAPLAIAGFALFIWLVMLLWNNVLTIATGVRSITYWQAAGIFLLSKILFGFSGGWKGRHSWRDRGMREKLANMSPEEREKFKSEWRNRCSRWGRKEDIQTPSE
ncbi:MAG TPA: hypothetical protein VGP43_07335 [Chitinophagaceae bacterium]|nr:hypothetical protein [Chitinophagaceae bacterium]